MPNRLELPDDLNPLIEKRETGERRQEESPASTGEEQERRQGGDRRQSTESGNES